ncbi:hypothetical protein [Maricaulis sp.]|jgi:hypothetical protein|uniref:hypothetical protein n=1 Tax=Maricaulis sp. TaxID=1486257 RepID=UPI002608290F|nr:hypothetical protein [Maricaulis sp.]MDF1767918.1 hypothetical protein [Maricaulis sp.]
MRGEYLIRPILVGVVASLLSACQTPGLPRATLATDQARSADLDLRQLPPQPLAVGSCGVFFWTADAERRFIAFEDLSSGRALLHVNGERLLRQGESSRAVWPVGTRYERRFTGQGAVSAIEIDANFDIMQADGLATTRAVQRRFDSAGTRTVIALSGHYACRSRPGDPEQTP